MKFQGWGARKLLLVVLMDQHAGAVLEPDGRAVDTAHTTSYTPLVHVPNARMMAMMLPVASNARHPNDRILPMSFSACSCRT